jgi:transposase
MDNATFHKGGRIEELIQKAGCRLLYLPPYSPELNRIEPTRVLVEESDS